MKIFISIASYQDALLPITINSAYTQAKFKDNISFGVIDQSKGKLSPERMHLKSLLLYELEDYEISRNSWLVVNTDPKVIFENKPKDLITIISKQVGYDIDKIQNSEIITKH